MSVRDQFYGKQASGSGTGTAEPGSTPSHPAEFDISQELRRLVHQRLEEKGTPLESLPEPELKSRIRALAGAMAADPSFVALPRFNFDSAKIAKDLEGFIASIAADVSGLGPIESLLADPDVRSIFVNGDGTIFYESKVMRENPRRFLGSTQLMSATARLLALLGSSLNTSRRIVEGRLSSGANVQIVLPPASLAGPTIAIRKGPANDWDLPELVRRDVLSPAMAQFLERCIGARLNLMISGGSTTGRTTLLSALMRFIPENERVVTIEDGPELTVNLPNLVQMQTVQPSRPGGEQITLWDLLRSALKMRPDRLILGECRGAEALDLLLAMNTGHDGCMSTIHANSPRDVVSRIAAYLQIAGLNLSETALGRMICSSVQAIIHLERCADGVLRITRITALKDSPGPDAQISFSDVFEYKVESGSTKAGRFRATGVMPPFNSRLEKAGMPLPPDLYAG